MTACKGTTCGGSVDTVAFSYDGEGHRTKIVATPAAGSPVTTTEFRYHGGAVVAEVVNGTLTREFVTNDAGTIQKVVVPSGQSDAGTYLVVWNGHGDATGLWRMNADGTLTLANSYTYGTWGRPTTATHNGISDLGFRYLYVGAYDVAWDDAFGLGLHYMHARHYHPALGRFLQPDPARAEANGYGYAGNGPITNVDPGGHLTSALLIVWANRLTLFGGGFFDKGLLKQMIFGWTWVSTWPWILVDISVQMDSFFVGRGWSVVSGPFKTTIWGAETIYSTRGYLKQVVCGSPYRVSARLLRSNPVAIGNPLVIGGTWKVPC
ncbi:MAG: RHS repeat-associated core domain-containing protein [Chloroflexota bacterium]